MSGVMSPAPPASTPSPDPALELRDADGRTPLVAATKAGDVETARRLILAGADVNAKDDLDDSAYLYAGAEGLDEILVLTLDHGADVRSLNRFGGTALIPAAEKGHPTTVQLLIEAGVPLPHQLLRLDRTSRSRCLRGWFGAVPGHRGAPDRGGCEPRYPGRAGTNSPGQCTEFRSDRHRAAPGWLTADGVVPRHHPVVVIGAGRTGRSRARCRARRPRPVLPTGRRHQAWTSA